MEGNGRGMPGEIEEIPQEEIDGNMQTQHPGDDAPDDSAMMIDSSDARLVSASNSSNSSSSQDGRLDPPSSEDGWEGALENRQANTRGAEEEPPPSALSGATPFSNAASWTRRSDEIGHQDSFSSSSSHSSSLSSSSSSQESRQTRQMPLSQLANLSHESAHLIPGPFVVLQGSPGDGMANTLDSMPVLSHHQLQAHPNNQLFASACATHQGIERSTSLNSTPRSSQTEIQDLLVEDCDVDGGNINQVNHSWSDTNSATRFAQNNPSSSTLNSQTTNNLRMKKTSTSINTASTKIHAATASNVSSMEGGLHLPLGPYSPIMRSNQVSFDFSNIPLPPVLSPAKKLPRHGHHSDSKNAVMTEEQNKTDHANRAEHSNIPSALPTPASTMVPHSRVESANGGYDIAPTTIHRTHDEQESERKWKEECRQNEIMSLEEVRQNLALLRQRSKRQAQHDLRRSNAPPPPSNHASATLSDANNPNEDNGVSIIDHRSWYQRDGQLVVLSALPHMSLHGVVAHPISTREGQPKDTLFPGCTVIALEAFTLDSTTLRLVDSEHSCDSSQTSQQQMHNTIQILKIESPYEGYVVSKVHGYSYIAPGLPSTYTALAQWAWRITYQPDGAFIRKGIELFSDHIDTLPFGSFCRVSRKVVNSMGLNRLKIEAYLDHTLSKSSLHDTNQKHDPNESNSKSIKKPKLKGWISEFLNPLSGQRGPVAAPVPFPVPALYRVVHPGGVVVRSGVELSTTQIGLAPMGFILSIVGRSYSNHPGDQCIECLRLAGGGGWISARLNTPPPCNQFLVEMIGVDTSFDPSDAATFHFEAQKKVMRELSMTSAAHSNEGQRSTSTNTWLENNSVTEIPQTTETITQTTTMLHRRSMYGTELSEVNEDGDDQSIDEQLLSSGSDNNMLPQRRVNQQSSIMRSKAPTLFQRGIISGGHNQQHLDQQNRCLVCLSDKRTATIVHGETGHIACCLMCARILKARGDNCPVCRLPIDLVIQHFWA